MVTETAGPSRVVLVVDDELDLVDSLRLDLEFHGYKVLTASDGLSALEIARSSVPDLILLDLILPGIDGYEVLKSLKSDARLRRIPVLVISARSDPQGVAQTLDWGDAACYYAKPLRMDVLLGLIQRTLEKHDVRG